MVDNKEIFDNRYEIIRRLGSGGMADVFLARDTHLGRQVAIKILYKRYADDDEFVARFRHEAQSAASLNHPHIVSIYDRGEAEGSYYIAMEYLEGKSLKEVIADKGRLEPSQAVDVAEQILQALQFAHENNVIHRDIKPHNIVINGRSQVKVTDFGIARASSTARMTETGSIIGTAQYLSPEQAKGMAVEQSSDLYSLGIVLFEMLTGQVPFEGENPVAIALKHLSDAPPPPQTLVPDIPDNLNAVVMKALAKNPEERYSDAGEFMADLERCRRDLPVEPPIAADDTAKTNVIGPAAAAAMLGAGAGAGEETTVVRPGTKGGRPEKKSRKKLILLWVLLASIALAAIAGGVYYLAVLQGKGIEVPSVVGLDQEQAEQILETAGFKVDVEAEEYSEDIEAGKVIRQNPDAGEMLREGGTVRLVISRGSGKVTVPDLLGQSASFAESKLRENDLNPDRQPDAYSDTTPEGMVISQDPPAGTEVQKSSSVRYVVSKGPEPPEKVTVPDLRGLTVDEAASRLSQKGLTLGNVTEEFSSSVSAGEVISQSPGSGQTVSEGSSVNITISKGPEVPQVTVPTLVTTPAMHKDDAIAALTSRGLGYQINPVPVSNPADVDYVLGQDPGPGTVVEEGYIVVIDVGV